MLLLSGNLTKVADNNPFHCWKVRRSTVFQDPNGVELKIRQAFPRSRTYDSCSLMTNLCASFASIKNAGSTVSLTRNRRSNHPAAPTPIPTPPFLGSV